jgi:hypothetical protein
MVVLHVPALPPGLANKLSNFSGYTNFTIDNIGKESMDWSIVHSPGGQVVCADNMPSNTIQYCNNVNTYPSSQSSTDTQIESLKLHNEGWVGSSYTYMTAVTFCADGTKVLSDVCTNGETFVTVSQTGVYTWATGGCTVAESDHSYCHGSAICCKNTSNYPTGPLTMCGPTCYDCTGAC